MRKNMNLSFCIRFSSSWTYDDYDATWLVQLSTFQRALFSGCEWHFCACAMNVKSPMCSYAQSICGTNTAGYSLGRIIITFQQSYLSQINTRQTSVEACFEIKSKSREQPVVFIPWVLYVSLHIGDFTFIAHAQKRHPDNLQTPENLSAPVLVCCLCIQVDKYYFYDPPIGI